MDQLEAAQIHIEQGLKSIPFWTKQTTSRWRISSMRKFNKHRETVQPPKRTLRKLHRSFNPVGFPEAHNIVNCAGIMLKMNWEDHYAVSRWAEFF